MPKKIDTEEFIRRSKIKHGDKFDYSLSVYTRKDDKITIICPTHGTFEQVANTHMRGFGCKKCNNAYMSQDKSLGDKAFIERCISKFGESRFDYSEVVYVNMATKIKVRCIKHDFKFLVEPSKHSSKCNSASGGCKLCANEVKNARFAIPQDQYIKRANEVHNNFYDYSKLHYRNRKSDVLITCPLHKDFWQNAASHLAGRGCPSCNSSGYNPKSAGVFYILKVTEDVIKFGITKDVSQRLPEINNNSTFDVQLLYSFEFIDGSIPQKIESSIKKDMSIERKVVNKADMRTGYTETTYSYNLPKILEIVENFTNASSE